MNFETYPFEKLNNLLKNITPNSDYTALSLTIGEPQFQTPKFILDELSSSAKLLNKYPKTSGEMVLREGMLTYLKNRFNLELNNSQIIPTLTVFSVVLLTIFEWYPHSGSRTQKRMIINWGHAPVFIFP